MIGMLGRKSHRMAAADTGDGGWLSGMQQMCRM
jgi:hypothetical protein